MPIPRLSAQCLGRLRAVSPWLIAYAAFVIVFYSWTMTAARKAKLGDLGSLIHVGEVFVSRSPEPLPVTLRVKEGIGFDGQFFLFLSIDPFLRKPSTVARLDAPFLRARRIGYPLLVNFLSRGKEKAIPWLMFLVTAAGISAAAGLLAREAGRSSLSPWWGLGYVVTLPVMVSASVMTCEGAAMGWVAASVVLFRMRHHAPACLCAAMAALTRETACLWPVAMTLWACSRRDWRLALLSGASLLPLLFWMAYLRWGVGLEAAAGDDAKNLTLPFAGITARLVSLLGGAPPAEGTGFLPDLLLLAATLLAPFAALYALAATRSAEALFLLLAAGLGVCLANASHFTILLNYPRQTFLTPLALFLMLTQGGLSPRLRRCLMALAGLVVLSGLIHAAD